jgi:hypothetical protein
MKSNDMSLIPKILLGFGAVIIITLGWYWLRAQAPSASVPKSISPASSATPPATLASRTPGKITEVGKSSITVIAPFYPGVPEGAFSTSTKKETIVFTVNAQTSITRQTLRPQAQFEAELAAYRQKQSADPAHAGSPPRPYTDVHLTLADLLPGMGVTITPTGASSTVAAEILVVSLPVAGQ